MYSLPSNSDESLVIRTKATVTNFKNENAGAESNQEKPHLSWHHLTVLCDRQRWRFPILEATILAQINRLPLKRFFLSYRCDLTEKSPGNYLTDAGGGKEAARTASPGSRLDFSAEQATNQSPSICVISGLLIVPIGIQKQQNTIE